MDKQLLRAEHEQYKCRKQRLEFKKIIVIMIEQQNRELIQNCYIMETSNKQFLQLKSRQKSINKLRNSKSFSDLPGQYNDGPFKMIQSNVDCRVVRMGHANQQEYRWALGREVIGLRNSLHKRREQQGSSNPPNSPKLKVNELLRGIKKSGQGSPISRVVIINKVQSHPPIYSKFNQEKQPRLRSGSIKKCPIQLQQKVTFLQQQLFSLTKERQNIKLFLSRQNQKLSKQNSSLKCQFQQKKDCSSQVQLMLQKQISKSLQLMDDNQALKGQTYDIKAQLLVKEVLIQTLQDEVRIIRKERIQQNQLIQSLRIDHQGQIEELRRMLESVTSETQVKIASMDQQFQQLKRDNQSLHDELQIKSSQLKTINNDTQNSLHEVGQSKQEVSLLNQSILTYQLKIQKLQKDLQTSRMNGTGSSFYKQTIAKQQTQCKRCQQLLKTVFRLNSHLNSKK